MLDDELLKKFMKGFYGFGNYDAQCWFVGIEEADDPENYHIFKQLKLWDDSGQKELLDVREFALQMGFQEMIRLYRENPPMQSTWRNLIRIYLVSQGQTDDNSLIRDYQREHWGTISGNTCLLELLPLPSHNNNLWIYNTISTLPFLVSRQQYENYIKDTRIRHIREKILMHKPKSVVLYGTKHDKEWKQIANVSSWQYSTEGIRYATNDNTLFISTKHSTRGSNQEFNRIGQLIQKYISKL